VASGTTKTARASTTANSITALAGLTKAAGPWANLAGVTGNTTLNGQGSTSRGVVISTTLTARVSGVLPNGVMLVEASKDVEVNSERQTITVRGIVRPSDVSSDNTVRSDHLGQLELRVNGKGVVGDAIKRPFILYRLLLGLLPF
jgi:flagellar L-ring protein precursor FlgH